MWEILNTSRTVGGTVRLVLSRQGDRPTLPTRQQFFERKPGKREPIRYLYL